MANEQKNRSLEQRVEALEKSEKLLAELFNKSSIEVGFMEARFQEIEKKLEELEEGVDRINGVEEQVDILEGRIQTHEYGT